MASVLNIIGMISQWFAVTSGASALALWSVAAFATCGLVLYFLTRGREFLATGYASIVFLIPFLHTH